jgi:hypothetical protein
MSSTYYKDVSFTESAKYRLQTGLPDSFRLFFRCLSTFKRAFDVNTASAVRSRAMHQTGHSQRCSDSAAALCNLLTINAATKRTPMEASTVCFLYFEGELRSRGHNNFESSQSR